MRRCVRFEITDVPASQYWRSQYQGWTFGPRDRRGRLPPPPAPAGPLTGSMVLSVVAGEIELGRHGVQHRRRRVSNRWRGHLRCVLPQRYEQTPRRLRSTSPAVRPDDPERQPRRLLVPDRRPALERPVLRGGELVRQRRTAQGPTTRESRIANERPRATPGAWTLGVSRTARSRRAGKRLREVQRGAAAPPPRTWRRPETE